MRRKRTSANVVEREHTDASLRAERRKTDRELRLARVQLGDDADVVIDKARRRADDVLQAARVVEDHALHDRGAGARERSAVSSRRARDDRQRALDRKDTDRELARGRNARARAHAGLLAAEREHTDGRLAIERQRADQAVSVRDDFFAMISHDLGNLLTAVSFNATALARLDRSANSQQQARYARAIENGTQQMVRLVGDLLDIARIDTGRLIVLPEARDGGALVRETVAAFAPVAAARQIRLSARVDARAAHAVFDRSRMFQVLSNLVSNALDFTPRGGRITVRVRPLGETICFSVEDTGAGIPREQLARIFDRGKPRRRGNGRKGLGIGLHIARSIVEAHGGRIWATSTPGRGTTFRFTLPKARPSSPGGSERSD